MAQYGGHPTNTDTTSLGLEEYAKLCKDPRYKPVRERIKQLGLKLTLTKFCNITKDGKDLTDYWPFHENVNEVNYTFQMPSMRLERIDGYKKDTTKT